MVTRYFLHVGYEGTNYRGWQWQPNVISVQEAIEKTLTKILKKEINVLGCGRTDAGVHASQYMLHINLEEPLDFDLKFRINKNLPEDIAVFDVIEMSQSQHARYSAVSRTYDYFIHTDKDPILGRYSSLYELENLDYEAMTKATALFLVYDDFRSVCKQPNLYNHTICIITNARLYVDESQGRMRFTITGNRFLRGMVRLCVYFLLKIGTGEMTLEEFEHILANKVVLNDNKPALPNGLYLSKVEYPFLKLDTRSDICSLLKKGLED